MKARLAERGLRIRDLARLFGCTPGHVYNVVTGARPSPRVIHLVEEVLKLPIYTDPDRLVSIPVGNSGKRVRIAAIKAVAFNQALEMLQPSEQEHLFEIAGEQKTARE